jgi:hypothetical protein
MSGVEIDRLKLAVEKKYGGPATFSETVAVSVAEADGVLWQGMVHVFDLTDHPTATHAYAWWAEGHSGQHYHAELHLPPVASACDAARKALTARRRTRRKR